MASERSAGKHRTICVREEFKIAVKLALDKFRFDENQKGTLNNFLPIFGRHPFLSLFFQENHNLCVFSMQLI